MLASEWKQAHTSELWMPGIWTVLQKVVMSSSILKAKVTSVGENASEQLVFLRIAV